MINMISPGEVMLIVWAGLGLQIEKHNETTEYLEIYISVPETSYHTNAHKEQMAGAVLAKRFKTVMNDMGLKKLIVKSRIRKGDNWTPEKAKNAEEQMKHDIYGNVMNWM